MKKGLWWIIGTICALALMVGAFFLYEKLSEDYDQPVQLQVQEDAAADTEENAQEEAAENIQNDVQPEDADEEVSYAAPDFTVVDAAGNEVKLSDYFGRPIVLNFWASWCPPCRAEMPYFEEVYKAREDVQFMMVNATGGRESMESAQEFIAETGYTFPVFYDTTGEAAWQYGVSSLPMTIFIDENGELVTYAARSIEKDTLELGISYITE